MQVQYIADWLKSYLQSFNKMNGYIESNPFAWVWTNHIQVILDPESEFTREAIVAVFQDVFNDTDCFSFDPNEMIIEMKQSWFEKLISQRAPKNIVYHHVDFMIRYGGVYLVDALGNVSQSVNIWNRPKFTWHYNDTIVGSPPTIPWLLFQH